LQHFDDDNPGVFGVSFTELGGQGLSAQYNASRQFVTASTYKLFVAFSTIKRVEAGQMKWDDANIANGRDLTKCFDDMIVKSDNACAEALIKKIGAKDLNADIKSLGLGSSGFRADNNVTTASDLASYLTQLEKGTMPIKLENRDRLLGAMKRNVYRQGVPAGASGQVADKVGFLWALLHDVTIVYSPKGTYVLVVLTDGSSWAKIAELTRKIEALR
jgi:beta-lactamase class A